MQEVTAPAGWYADPYDPGSSGLRWWDGQQWTGHVAASRPAQVVLPAASVALHVDDRRVRRLPADGRQRVVGEHFHQDSLRRICRGKHVPIAGYGNWDESLSVTARLVPEHDNPYDSTAVRIDVQGMAVGHLPREEAPAVHAHLSALAQTGTAAECEGRIVIARNGDYGIYLHLSDLDAVAFFLGLGDNQISMDGRWHAAAVGVRAYQDVLGRLCPEERIQRTLVATLDICTVTTGKYAGERTIEVRVNGHRVGQLSHIMSVRYGQRVADIVSAGKTPACRAVLSRGQSSGVGVTIFVPAPDRP